MISNIPLKISAAAKAVTRRHPMSMDCVVYRKVFTRVAPDGSTLGGAATLGGLGVLTPEDEPEYTYQKVGTGRILITSKFEGNIESTDRLDSYVPEVAMQESQIEPDEDSNFHPKKYDLVGAMPGGGVLIGFEIVSVPTTVAIYPYTQKYIIAPRDELSNVGPWEAPDA